jgi:hypothetical protein
MDRTLARIVFSDRGRMSGSSRFSGLLARVPMIRRRCVPPAAPGERTRLLLEPERPHLDDGGEVAVRLVPGDGHEPLGPPAAPASDESGGRPPVQGPGEVCVI